MKDALTMYSAWRAYLDRRSDDPGAAALGRALLQACAEGDALTTCYTYPRIREDWLVRIEAEMVYVEKAVREERQFILQAGEVVPVEKAKRVSRESVRQLARHSEQITHAPMDPSEDLVPEKIYTVENLSDYAVYENRFLYMLLCYTRDFITLRLNKILELGQTRYTEMALERRLNDRKRELCYSLRLQERDREAGVVEGFEACRPQLGRMEDQLILIAALLATPLMQEVARAPMLTPPITPTNVLTKNNNFKHALDLYHYLSSYEGAGYEIEEIHADHRPLPEALISQAGELFWLGSLLAHQYADGTAETMEADYLAEQARIRREHQEEQARRLAELRGRWAEAGEGPEEYIGLLEETNRRLEGVEDKLATQLSITAALEEDCRRLQGELGAGQDRLTEQRAALGAAHAAQLSQREAHIAALTQELQETKEALARTEAAHALTHARLTALRQTHGDFAGEAADELAASLPLIEGTDRIDYTDAAGFAQLEREFESFAAFFFGRWAQTRRRLRRQILYAMPGRDKATGAIVTPKTEPEEDSHEKA